MSSTVKIGNFIVGRGNLLLIAGPCVIESETMVLRTAKRLKELAERCGFFLVFKSSYQKANRLSGKSYAGPGLDAGLKVLEKVKREFELPLTADIHSAGEAASVGEIVDLIQIPAFLCRQTDLVAAAARTGKAVNIKKGQFVAPEDMKSIAEKAIRAGNRNILLTERGTAFGYHNLVVDFRSLVIMRNLGYPVVYDATHSLQLPGANGATSGGQREFALPLARAAIACGVDGIFLETHPDPSRALSDRETQIPLAEMPKFLKELKRVTAAAKR